MKFSTNNLLTTRNVFKKIDSFDIFSAYCPNFQKIGVSFKSDLPLRAKEDTNASCQIEYIGGDLLFTDFGDGSYRALPYVMRKFGLTFKEALNKINQDFNLKLIDNENITVPKSKVNIKKIRENKPKIIHEKKDTILDVLYKPFDDLSIKYWEQYGWSLEMLKKASIRPIEMYWLTMEHKGIFELPIYVGNKLAFSFDYYRHNEVFRRKLYFPEDSGDKRFVSNVDDTIIQNWDLLPKEGGDMLFITSSKKDTGPFYRLYGGLTGSPYWNSIAPNSELNFIQSDTLYKLKQRFKTIILYFDNDSVGIKNAKKLAHIHNLEYLYNPIGSPKDPSDMWKEGGGRLFRRILKQESDNKYLNIEL